MKKSHLSLTVIAVLLLTFLWVGTGNIYAEQEESTDLFLDTIENGERDRSNEPTIVRSRFVKVNLPLLPSSCKPAEERSDYLELNLFDDVYYRAVVQRMETNKSGTISWTGRIEGVERGQAILVYKDGLVAGNISVPSGFYQIRWAGNGIHAIYELDHSKFSPCANGEESSTTVQAHGPGHNHNHSHGKETTPGAGHPHGVVRDMQDKAAGAHVLDDGSSIDVLVVYTADARAGSGNTAAIETEIDLAITETNQGYANSDVTQRLNLVHTAEVLYTETSSISIDRNRLQSSTDGFLDEVHLMRDATGADLVAFIVEDGGGYCGIAFIMDSVSTGFEDYGFCVVARECATGYYSFGHELGHIMSARHDYYVDPTANSPYTYNHGYVSIPGDWRTIMAYNTDCSANGDGYCSRLDYWSNPAVDYSGLAMGVAEGEANAADNHKTLNNTAGTVANFRTHGTTPTLWVSAPDGGEALAVDSSTTITWSSFGTVGNVMIEYSNDNGDGWTTVTASTANDGSYTWTVPDAISAECLVRISEASDGDPSDTSDEVFSITSGTPPVITLNRHRLNFASELSGATSENENLVISNTGGDSLAWTATDDAAWLSLSPASGTDFSTVTVSVDSTGLEAGTHTATITVNGADAENTPQQVSVTLTVYQNGNTSSPFGEFATPAEGSTVSSSVPITGWVLDDIGIESVKIYNGESYVGDALLVEGARTDIEQSYPYYPGNYKAGWGYMLLTYFLPDGGNGTYTLTARATDNEGNIVSLGSKTVTINNNSAVKPFGAIDTPAQGGAAFGSSFRNAGWVLTPQPNTVPADGSTINVYVDGVFLGNPVYNIYRPDIAALFPGYNNSNTAHAYFDFDTTAYSNGVHTIYWVATDDAGNADGIGSRFFTIANTESVQLVSSMQGFKAKKQTFDPAAVPVNVSEPVSVIKGYGKNVTPKNVYPNQKGFIKIEIKELERVVLDLGARSGISGSEYFAYTRVGKQLRDLPAGSTLDSQKGLLYWQPGPGFVGTYDLVLFAKDKNGMVKKTNLRIKITPRFQ